MSTESADELVEFIDLANEHGAPGLAASAEQWEAWLRRLPSIPMPDAQRRELMEFAQQIIKAWFPERYPDTPPL